VEGEEEFVRGDPDPLGHDGHVGQLFSRPERLQLTAPVNRGHKHFICKQQQQYEKKNNDSDPHTADPDPAILGNVDPICIPDPEKK